MTTRGIVFARENCMTATMASTPPTQHRFSPTDSSSTENRLRSFCLGSTCREPNVVSSASDSSQFNLKSKSYGLYFRGNFCTSDKFAISLFSSSFLSFQLFYNLLYSFPLFRNLFEIIYNEFYSHNFLSIV